jgi:hypothetical protein
MDSCDDKELNLINMDKDKIIEMINSYWKFDDDQQPLSSWHDKQDLISAIEQLRLHVFSISLLKKYMQHVENCEGVNFVSDIGRDWSGIEFSKEEKALLEKLDAEIEQSNEC